MKPDGSFRQVYEGLMCREMLVRFVAMKTGCALGDILTPQGDKVMATDRR